MENKENTELLAYVRLEDWIFTNNQSPLNTLHIRNIQQHEKKSTNMSDDLLKNLCCFTNKHPSCGRSSISHNSCGSSTTGSWLLNINVLLLPLLVNATAMQLSIVQSQTRKPATLPAWVMVRVHLKSDLPRLILMHFYHSQDSHPQQHALACRFIRDKMGKSRKDSTKYYNKFKEQKPK